MRPVLRRALLLPLAFLALGMLPALAYYDLKSVDAYGVLTNAFTLTGGAATTFSLTSGGPGGGPGNFGASTLDAPSATLKISGGTDVPISNFDANALSDLSSDYTTITGDISGNAGTISVTPGGGTEDLSLFEGGTLTPNEYKINGNATLGNGETLTLNSNGVGGDLYIYVTGSLTIHSGATIQLTGTPTENPANVFWIVGGTTTIGDNLGNGNITFDGTLLTQGGTTLNGTSSTASVVGRVLDITSIFGNGTVNIEDAGLPPNINMAAPSGTLQPDSGNGSTAATALVVCQGNTISYQITAVDNTTDNAGVTTIASANSTGGAINGYSDGSPVSGPSGGTATMTVTYTPPVHAYGPGDPNAFSVTYTATDAFGALEYLTVFIRVSQPPLIDVTGLTPPYCNGQTVSLKVTVSDSDSPASGETFGLSATGIPAGATQDNPLPVTGVPVGTLITDNISFVANGPVTITFTSTNSDGCTASSPTSVTITPDAAPVVTLGTVTGNSGTGDGSSAASPLAFCIGQATPLSFPVSATQPNPGDTVTLTVTGLPVTGSPAPTQTPNPAGPSSSTVTTTFTWSPTVAVPPTEITYSALDSAAPCSTATTLNVWVTASSQPVIAPPAIVSGQAPSWPGAGTSANPFVVCDGMTLVFTETANDADAGSTVTLNASGVPANMTFANQPLPATGPSGTGSVSTTASFTPSPGQANQCFTVTFNSSSTAGCPGTPLTVYIFVDNVQFDNIQATPQPIPSPSAPGATLVACVGQPLFYDIETSFGGTQSCAPAANSLSLSVIGTPVGAAHDPDEDGVDDFGFAGGNLLADSTIEPPGNVLRTRFSWTPLAKDVSTSPYTLVYTSVDTFGCEMQQYVTIYVVPTPTLSASVTGGSPAFTGPITAGETIPVCIGNTLTIPITAASSAAGDTVQLTEIGAPGAPDASFSPGLPQTGNPATSTLTFTPDGTHVTAGTEYFVTFTSTDSDESLSTTSGNSGLSCGASTALTFQIRVDGPPTISLSPGTTTYNVCAGATVQFNVTASDANLGDEVTLKESDPNGLAQFFQPLLPVSGNTAATATQPSTVQSRFKWATAVGSPASTTLTFTATDTDGCTATQTVTINVTQVPVVNIGTVTGQAPGASGTGTQGNPYVVCAGMTISFPVTATEPNAGDTVTLSDGNPTNTTLGTLTGAIGAAVTGTFSFSPPANQTAETIPVTFTGTDNSAAGCAGTDVVYIRVSTAPTISLSPGTTTYNVCAGQNVTFQVTGKDTNVGDEVTLSESGGLGQFFTPLLPLTGDEAIGGTASTATSVFNWTTGTGSPASTTLTFTATNTDGCVTTSTVTINVTQIPVVTTGTVTGQAPNTSGAGTQANPYVVCAGMTLAFPVTATEPNAANTVTLSDSGLPNSTLTGTLTSPTAGATVTGNFSFTPAPGQDGSTVSVTFTATDSSGTCPGTLTIYIRVSSLPLITVSGGVTNNGSVTICAGTNVSFNVSATDPDAGSQITLSESDGNGLAQYFAPDLPLTSTIAKGASAAVQTAFSWTPPANSAGSSTVLTFTSINADGCTAAPVTVTINVSALPTFVSPPTPTAGSTLVVCAGKTLNWTVEALSNNVGQNVTLTDSGTNPSGTTSTGTGSGATTADLNYTFSPPANASAQTYTVTYTASLSGSQSCPQTWSFQIRVDALPTISFGGETPSFVGSNNVYVCAGGTVQFVVTATDVNPTNEVTLSETGGLSGDFQPLLPVSGNTVTGSQVSTAQSQFKLVTAPTAPTSDTTITFTATDTDGCVSSTTVTIHVRQTPVVSIGAPTGQAPGASGNGTQGNPLVVCATPSAPLAFTVTASNPNPGDQVQLTGSNVPSGASFTGGTSAVGAAESAGFSWSPTANQGGQTFAVTFTGTDVRPNGCSSSLIVYIRVSSLPTITLSPGTTTYNVCAGQNVSFEVTGQDTNVGDEVTLSESDPNGLGKFFTPLLPLTGDTAIGGTASTATSVFNWTTGSGSPASTTLTFTATNTDGCAVTSSVTINVTQLPVVSISNFAGQAPAASGTGTQANPLVVCATPAAPLTFTVSASEPNAGGKVTLSETGLPTGATMNGTLPITGATGAGVSSNFSWSPTAGQGGSTYSITYTGTDNSPAGCAGSLTVYIRVSSLPSITVTPGTTPINVCAGQTVTFTVAASDTNVGNEVTLSESGGLAQFFTPVLPLTGGPVKGASPSSVQSVFNWTPGTGAPASTLLTFRATNSDGCVTTSSITINVTQIPVVSINTITGQPGSASGTGTQANPLVVCATPAVPLTFNVTASEPNEGDTVTLTGSNLPSNSSLTPPSNTGNEGTAVTSVFSFNPAANQGGQTYAVTFTGTDSNGPSGCPGTLTVYIRVSSLPSITLSPSNTVYNVCAGQNVTFSVAASDTNLGDEVTLSESGGLSQFFTPSLPFSGNKATASTPSNVQTVFNWTTGSGAPASTTLTFTATNTDGCVTTTTVTINVAQIPAVTISAVSGHAPNASGNGSQTNPFVVCAAPAGEEDTIKGPKIVPPTLTFNVTASEPNAGSAVTLSDGGLPANAFMSPALPLTGAVGQAVTSGFSFSPSSSQGGQTYAVTYTATDGGPAGCASSITVYIRVSSLPTLTLTPTTTVYTVCVGQNVNFSVAATDSNVGDEVTLSESGGLAAFFTPALPFNGNKATATTTSNVQTVFNWTPGVGAPARPTLTFTATNTDGCAVSTSVTINVVQIPTVSISGVQNAQPTSGSGTQSSPFVVCATPSLPLEFTVTANEPNPGDMVTLSDANLPTNATMTPTLPVTGATGQAVSSLFAFSPAANQGGQTFAVTFTATDSSSAQCNSSVTVYIRVSSLPTITFSNASPAFSGDGGNVIMICDGDTATFKTTFQDTNAGGFATLGETGAPATAVFTPTLPRTAASPTTAQTTFTYTSPRGSASSYSDIVFTATNADGCQTQKTITLVVFHTSPTTLTLSGFTPPNPAVGDQVCLTANVKDNCPNGPRPYPGDAVTFTLTGTAGTSPGEGTSTTITTDANGNAQFCFTVLTEGTISVSVSAAGIPGTVSTGTTVVNPPPVNTTVDSVTGSGSVDSRVSPAVSAAGGVPPPSLGPVVTGGAQFSVNVADNAKHKLTGTLTFNIPTSSVRGTSTQLQSLEISPVAGGYTATLTGLMTIVQKGASTPVRFSAAFTQIGNAGGPSDSFQLLLFDLNGDDVTSPTVGSNLRLSGKGTGLTNDIIIRVGKAIPGAP